MKRLAVLVATGVLALALATAAQAQTPAAPHGAQHPPAAGPATPTPGAPGAMPTMDMCAQMMGGMAMPMGEGGARMMGPADPKERAAMLEMRGDMMKAMGEVMLKHARRMQGGTGN